MKLILIELMFVGLMIPGKATILATANGSWSDGTSPVHAANDSVEFRLAFEISGSLGPCPGAIDCPAIFDVFLLPTAVGSVFVFDSANPSFSKIVGSLETGPSSVDVLFNISPNGSGSGQSLPAVFGLANSAPNPLFMGATVTSLNLTITSTQFAVQNLSGLGNRSFGYQLDVVGTGPIAAAANPEPSTWLLTVTGLAVWPWHRRQGSQHRVRRLAYRAGRFSLHT